MLFRRPGVTVLAVFSLAIGVGANTTMFSTVNALLWRSLPVFEPERLVRVYQHQGSYSSFSYPNFRDVRDQVTVLDGMFLHGLETFGLNADGRNEIIYGEVVTSSYFDVLGIDPAVGTFFSPGTSGFVGASPVVVLSYSLWQRSFGGTDVVGRNIRLNNHSVTVTGVAPEGFEGTKFGLGMDAWVPVEVWGGLAGWGDWMQARGTRRLEAVARLASGVSDETLTQALENVGQRLSVEYPETNRDLRFEAFPERVLTPDAGDLPALIGLLAIGASGLVLLVACANVASLLYARGVSRRKEFSVRLALGASRTRLLQQLLTESALLALLGGGIGIATSFWASGFIYLFLPSIPYRFALHTDPDWRVIGFASIVSILALFVFGLTPALQASRSNAGLAMRSDTAGSGMSVKRARVFDAVVVTTVSLSFVTLVLSALFSRSLAHVRQLDPGFGTSDRMLASFDVTLGGRERSDARAFYEQLEERIAALPGVQNAGVTSSMPLGDSHSSSRIYATDMIYDAGAPGIHAWRASVSDDYFATAGIPVLQGRSFGSRDTQDSPRVVVVNVALAEQVWGELDVVGRRLTYSVTGEGDGLEVIGVVPTGRYQNANESPRPAMYSPLKQSPVSSATLMVHADPGLDPLSLSSPVRSVVAEIDPIIPMFDVKTVDAHLTGSLWMFRLGAGVGGGMGLLALILAAGGLYGIMAFSVSQRLRELGIRVALGAGRRQVLVLVLKKAIVLVGVGVAVGGALSLAGSGMLTGMLVGVQPRDPVTFLIVGGGMIAVAILATIIPAGSATRADPVTVLRTD